MEAIGRQSGFDHFAKRACVVIGNPTRELQNLRTANWLGVDKILRVFYVDFGKFSGKLVRQADDVARHKIPAERHDKTRADLSLSTLFRVQAISKRLKDMQRNCDFSV